ncbi:MAG: hypothetical protein ACOC1P_05215 [Minisyncoccales bacterium]
MLRDPKIRIQKKKILNDKGHFRFYFLNGKNKDIPLLKLEKMPEIKTEKDLLSFVYNHFGPGDYLLIAYAKGHKGFWVFWRGEITDKGWIFYPKNYNRKEINKWDKDISETEDKEEKEVLKEMKEEIKKEEKARNKKRRYGFEPFLKRSGNRGEFRFWDDDNLVLKPQDDEEVVKKDWSVLPNQKEENKLPDWGFKPKEEKLEKW